MTEAAPLRLAELLAARLCHELAGPLAAIGNGVELIAEEGAAAAADAVGLVADSARRASGRLQVNFQALQTRFSRTTRRRRSSPMTRKPGAISKLTRRSGAVACNDSAIPAAI